MDVSTSDGSMRVAPDEIGIAPHPAWPDNVLIGLCRRFRERLTQWGARVVAWQESGTDVEQVPAELVRLKRLWEADLVLIRSIDAQTPAGVAARFQVARMLIERSAAGDGEVLEFLRQTIRNHEIIGGGGDI